MSQPSARLPRLAALDGLRLVAALSVLAFHYTSRDNTAWGQPVAREFPHLSEVTAYGYLGVQVFFLISGFVILMSAWGKDVAHFTASRIGRLYPAYWTGVILSGVVLLLVRPETSGGKVDMGFKEAISNLSMIQSALGIAHVDGVYWTLWVELRFYVLIGLFILVGITRRRVLTVCGLWPLAALMAEQTGSNLLVAILQPDYAPLFAIGMLLYLVHREGPSPAAALLIFLNWTVVVAKSDDAFQTTYDRALAANLNGTVVAAVLTAAIAVIWILSSTRVQHVRSRWLTVAGALTYPLYLIHQHLGWWLISWVRDYLPPTATLGVVVLTVLGIAAAIHYGVERPLCGRLRRAVEGSLVQAPSRTRS